MTEAVDGDDKHHRGYYPHLAGRWGSALRDKARAADRRAVGNAGTACRDAQDSDGHTGRAEESSAGAEESSARHRFSAQDSGSHTGRAEPVFGKSRGVFGGTPILCSRPRRPYWKSRGVFGATPILCSRLRQPYWKSRRVCGVTRMPLWILWPPWSENSENYAVT